MSVLFGPLSALWYRLGARPYDAMYRRGAPWDNGPRAELVELLDSGRLSAANGSRALDVGCGTGADSRLLAEHGFDVVGIDFSAVAVAAARSAGGGPRYVQTDLFDLPGEVADHRFDLIFDGGTIDDLPPTQQRESAGILTGLARPGTALIMWCFSLHREDAPWFSLTGPSRLGGMGIIPEEVHDMFGPGWDIEPLPTAHPAAHAACYWMTRRGRGEAPAAGPPGVAMDGDHPTQTAAPNRTPRRRTMKTDIPADVRMMGIVHSALKRDLHRAREVLAADPAPRGRQRVALGEHIVWMLDFLHGHHSGEDAGLWPLVRERNPSSVELLDSMEADHARIAPAADATAAAAAEYTATTTEAPRQALVHALDHLLAVLVPHLDREVAEAMPVVSASISNREWDDIEQRFFVKKKSTVELAMEGHWFIEDIDSEGYDVVVHTVNPVLRFVLIHGFGPAYRRRAKARWSPDGA